MHRRRVSIVGLRRESEDSNAQGLGGRVSTEVYESHHGRDEVQR